MFSKTNVISTSAVKHNQIKLPVGLAKHPDLEKAIIKVEGDHVTFTLPPKNPNAIAKEIWQYVAPRKQWVHCEFTA
jgi:hypothetical protein